ncbi:hypothetical protein J7I93_23030 [Bacillus sp. ISL-47]|uniref:hypothetical protein n=1 Tax=Bacillus sp. ISL-47 TaxID=2819130 RepID=UPI001BEC1C32|nr:hypothetical protein [Bacillus sp. ISL-47]MBT2691013.1 hypothetical protein [Bacillus sp. ISL-47]MBT2710893.1 hypothetical protein [Pseudomonas sp. ISL-84]
MLKNKKISPIISIIGIIFAIAIAYSLLVYLNNEQNTADEQNSSKTAEMAAQDLMYGDLGDFIATNHTYYNETLGWGRDRFVSWSKQRKQADLISSALNSLSAENQDLQHDLDTIGNLAEAIGSGSKDKENLIKLHRFFHDLDIDYNDYKDTTDYFDVTEYKGED